MHHGPPRTPLRRLLPRLAVPLVAALWACGGGGGGGAGGCGGCLAPTPGGFPVGDKRHEGAIQVRATHDGVRFLSDNGDQLIGSLLPGGATNFPVPACPGMLCCGGGNNCNLSISLKNLTLSESPANALALTTRVALASMNDVQVSFAVGPITTHCHLTLDTSKGSKNKDIGFSGDLTFSVDGETRLTRIALEKAKIVDLEPAMLTLKPVNPITDFLQCNAGNLGFVQNILIGQIATQVSSQVDAALCQTCKTKGDCDGLADDCKGGQCVRKGQCLQQTGAQGRLDLAGLSALFAGSGAAIDTLAVLGGYAESYAPGPGDPAEGGGGLSLGMLGGAQAAARNPCVPARPAPMAPTVPRWSQDKAGVEPRDRKPYHLGIGIHQSHLDTLAWAAYDGGALCLHIGTAQSAMLTSAGLGILFPSLAELTHGAAVPLVMAVRPQQAPRLVLGQGTFEVDPKTMKKTIKEPLLRVEMPQLAIDFYALVEERYVRIMRLGADLSLPLALDVDDKGQIVPMLGDLAAAFGNLKVTDSELLSEPPDRIARSFPVLLSVAAGTLGQLAPVALPEIMGLKLSLVALEPTDNLSFLGLFANLESAAGPVQAVTMAEVSEVLAPPTSAFRVEAGLDPLLQPRVVLRVSGRGARGDDADLEYSVRLDGGLWSLYQPGPRLEVSDPKLWIQGHHRVEVRARVVGQPRTTDPQPVVLDALVDTVAPAGGFDVAGSPEAPELDVAARDLVTPAGKLQWRVRLASGAWSEWAPLPKDGRVSAPGPIAAEPELAVRDEAGNESGADFHGRTQAPMGAGGCGCTLGGRGLSTEEANRRGPILLIALVIALTVAARRRRRLPAMVAARACWPLLALALLFAGASGCNADAEMAPEPTLGKSDLLDPADEIGRFTDAVAAAGVIHVAAYDGTQGDLAYAQVPVADVGKPIAWQWVDGVPAPADPMSPAPDAYRRGQSDAGDDVGQYASLALDKSQQPRIAYYDVTHRALKYARANGRTWESHTVATVDSKSESAWAGRYASLSLDEAGVPSIAFMAYGLPDGKGGLEARLRIATARSATPAGLADWTVLDVDRAPIPCAGEPNRPLCEKGSACVARDPMDPTKGSTCAATMSGCPGCQKTQACIAGACVDVVQPPAFVDLPEGTGLFASLVRLPGGLRAIAYHDRTAGDCKLASETAPGTFNVALVDGNSPTTDVGQFVTARAAPDGTVHLAYVDAVADRLLYKAAKGGSVPAMPEVVDDGVRPEGTHAVGGGAALWEGGGAVKIAYQDQQLADLRIASRAGGAWSHTAARSGVTAYGFYPRLVSDGGKLYVVQMVVSRAAAAMSGPLSAVEISAL